MTARVAGLLYLLDAVAAPFRMLYVPGRIIVSGDAVATANNIVANETLFRAGIASDLFCGVVEIFLVLSLYRLFRRVDRNLATVMVVLGLMTVPLFFVNVLNDSAALILAKGTALPASVGAPAREGLVMLFLQLHHQSVLTAEIFYGLWLFPLAALVWRCGFLPRFLGAWLTANGFAYLALSVAGLSAYAHEATVIQLALPAQFAELVFLGWLLIVGVPAESLATRSAGEPVAR